MARTYQLGAVRIAQLHDGYGAIDGNRVFYPASQAEWGEGLGADPLGFMLNAYQPLLIAESGEHTLVDTGFGETNPARKGDIQAGMKELGIVREEIARVIISHAHGDHIGGNTVLREGRYVATYPNALYVVQEREVAAMRGENSDLWQQRFAPLESAGQLRLVDGEVACTPSLTLWPMAGHTEGQQGVRISSEGQQAVFVGDLGLSIKSFAHLEWGSSWAWSREADEANRRMVAEWAADNGALVILYHDPRTPWFRIALDGDGYRPVPV
jgi:glyoxylase-like metal-dependent hydrolase (beta-lactamase superfamily II)